MEDFICSVCEVVYDHEPEIDDFVVETSPLFDTNNQCPECGLTIDLTIATPPTIDSTIIN